MATLFSKIIAGEIPGRFVWADDVCVAFLTIEPITDGHVLVVPRAEIEQWTDADEQTWTHLQRVARIIGRAQQAEWGTPRIGMLLEGFLVDHLHIHTWPARGPQDFDPHATMSDVEDERFEDAARRLRERLTADGHEEHVAGPGPL
ncbi:HIT family protein [Marihabitans asiaticum]|uniref:Histidine triad (HIT) family protein n=1 Tax=Marihabitans asiaticum TaxID=415218 RepID=A0A560W892_9MICO|nr:HIT family protein [Marihabitans asiaticum]TWD13847.1 histidine triad (HIT) family protein [Marihabitans asiaticum]